MWITIASDDERPRLTIDLELPRDAEELVLVDDAGNDTITSRPTGRSDTTLPPDGK
jgi:hypothetical protein